MATQTVDLGPVIGPQGPKGDTGPGVPTGGAAGQLLVKVNATDHNTAWREVGEAGIAPCRTMELGDFDDMTKPGLYMMHDVQTASELPMPGYGNYGLLVLQSDDAPYIQQIATAESFDKVFLRRQEVSGGEIYWSDWVELATTAYVDSKAGGRQWYGACTTTAATVDKPVPMSGFTLQTGVTVAVRFTYANTAANPSLNVNSTGAKPIYHCETGAAITPGDILAGMTAYFVYNGTQWVLLNPAGRILTFTNAYVNVSGWVSDTKYAAQGYNWRAAIYCQWVTAKHIPDVTFALSSVMDGNLAPVAESYTDGVYIYAKTKPTTTVFLPSIVCMKGV